MEIIKSVFDSNKKAKDTSMINTYRNNEILLK